MIIKDHKNIKEIHCNSKKWKFKIKMNKKNDITRKAINRIASFKSLMNFYYSKIMKMNKIINIGNINASHKTIQR
jgi:hypothetical protein